MGLFGNSLDKWIQSATDEELDSGYEKERQKWLKNGCNDKRYVRSPEMEKIDREICKRAAEKRKKDPRNNLNDELPKHQHGWYLPEDND